MEDGGVEDMEFESKGTGALDRRLVALLMTGTFLTTVATIGLARAQTPQPARAATAASARDLNIPAQSLASALIAFSRQTRMQIFADQALVAGKNSPAISGALAPSAALNRLLAGSGLSYRFTGANAVTIVGPESANSDRPPASDGSLLLDPIDVSGKGDRNAASGSGFQGTPDWVYSTPASVSVISRQALDNRPPRQAADMIRDTAGVWTETDRRHPGTTVNIRGLQSQGRLAMTIDDARQNFRKLYAAASSQDRTFIDPNLLRTVEIEKTRSAGVGGAGALGGVVNFRTIEADDILKPGANYGVTLNGTTGTNAYDFSGSVAAATRLSDSFDLVAAVSRRKIGDFKPGQEGLDEIKKSAQPGSGLSLADATISKATQQESWSGLVKATLRPTDNQTVKLSYVGMTTDFAWATSGETEYLNFNNVKNHTLAADYTWRPGNPLIDLAAKVYYNQTLNNAFYPVRMSRKTVLYCPCDTNVDLDTLGGFVRNKSEFDLGWANVTANYGIEVFNDKSSASQNIDGPSKDPGQKWFASQNGNGAERLIAGAFGELSIRLMPWLDIRPALRYDHWNVTGSGQQVNQPAGPMGWLSPYWEDFSVDRSAGRASPTLTIAVEPFKGTQVYGKYVEGYRPPTLQEIMFSGIHLGTSSLLTPIRFAPNPYLEPEESRTFEIGLNAKYDNVLWAGDAFRFKASVFESKVDNYVALARVVFPGADPNNLYFTGAYAWVNLTNEVKFHGTELEVNYDIRMAYVGVSYTRLRSDFGSLSYDVFWRGQGSSSNYTGNPNDLPFSITVPPRHKVTLDAGLRFFDERLTFGSRIHHSAETIRTGAALSISQSKLPAYTTVDLYGSWKITEDVVASLAVDNLTNVAYGDALGLGTLLAPGRTVTGSLKVKF
jgi:TonB-dependent heme/hemoglobin receptor